MRKEFALIMVSCIIGVSSAYGDSQINITQSPSQTVPPFTVTDSSSNVLFRVLSDGQAIINQFIQFSGSGLTALRTYVFPDSDGTVVLEDTTQPLLQKTIDANFNTISNIENDNIKSNATIDVTKLSTGTINNTEFDYLNGTTSNIQTQLDSKGPSTVRLASDVVVTTNVIQDVTGLSFPVSANSVYSFNFDILYDVTASTTGDGFSVNCTGCVVAKIGYTVKQPRGVATTVSDIYTRNVVNTIDAGARSMFTTSNHVTIDGVLVTGGTGGTLIVRGISEIPATAVTVKAGSNGLLHTIP
ncbi:MAG: hypothetical protein WEB28_00705 [Nitrosopumilaceae archaeon]